MVGYFLSDKEITHLTLRSSLLLGQTFKEVVLEYWLIFLLLGVFYLLCLVGLSQYNLDGPPLR